MIVGLIRILIISFILTISFCSRKKKEIAYYDTGELKSECTSYKRGRVKKCIEYYKTSEVFKKYTTVDNRLHGEYIQYYEIGAPEIISNYDMGKLSGRYLELYHDGKVFNSFYYVDNKREGWGYNSNFSGDMVEEYFFENDSLRIAAKWFQSLDERYKIKKLFKVFGLDTKPYGRLFYDKDGKIDKSLSFGYTTTITRDTVLHGDFFEALLTLYTIALNTRFKIILGNFYLSESYKLIYTDELPDNVFVKDYQYIHREKAEKRGRNVIKGLIYESYNNEIFRTMPFYIEYYVK